MCHTLVGDKNGAAISGCNRERDKMEARVTCNLSGFGVAPGIVEVAGGRRDIPPPCLLTMTLKSI